MASRLQNFNDTISRELDRLALLETNWDAQGARPIAPASIEAARRLVSSLPPDLIWAPAIVPMAKGNLQFEWHQGARSLELEIEEPQTIHYLKWDPEEGVENEGSFPLGQTSRTVELILWFTKGVTHG